MKNCILFLLCFLLVFTISAQERVKVTTNFDPSGKIYNKHTGKKISDAEFNQYIEKNPNVVFEEEYNKHGEVVKYLLDTTRRTAVKPKEKEFSKGEKLPEFAVKTIEGSNLSSENLLGKWIILRFELFANMINKEEYSKINQEIEMWNDAGELVMISFFMQSKAEIESSLDINGYSIHHVENGSSFMRRYGVTKIPKYLLIDPEGYFVQYFTKWNEVDLKQILEDWSNNR